MLTLPENDANLRLTWIRRGSSMEHDAFGTSFENRSGRSWDGVTVLEGRVEPFERLEGHFLEHVLTVNLGGKAVPFEARLPGRPRIPGVTRPGYVNVWPAEMPHSIHWLQKSDWCVVAIEPALAATVATSLEVDKPPDSEAVARCLGSGHRPPGRRPGPGSARGRRRSSPGPRDPRDGTRRAPASRARRHRRRARPRRARGAHRSASACQAEAGGRLYRGPPPNRALPRRTCRSRGFRRVPLRARFQGRHRSPAPPICSADAHRPGEVSIARFGLVRRRDCAPDRVLESESLHVDLPANHEHHPSRLPRHEWRPATRGAMMRSGGESRPAASSRDCSVSDGSPRGRTARCRPPVPWRCSRRGSGAGSPREAG